MIKIFINDTDYTSYITGTPTISSQFEDGKLIGNAPSACLSLSLDNVDKVFNELLDSEFVVKDYTTDTLIGKFIVTDKPERITSELALTLYDHMVDTNIGYNTNTEMYPTTISEQINEMETLLGRTIDTTELGDIVLGYDAEWYDNTISIRDFLCFIGELGACNVFCMSDGNYKFKKIVNDVQHELEISDVETVDVIEEFICTRIVFDNGAIEPFITGDETGNTIYISMDNSYVKNQEQIDYIYSLLNGVNFQTMQAMKCVEMKELMLGDIFTFNNIRFIALNYSHDLLSGDFGIQTIDGNLVIKNAELVTQYIDNTVRIHRLTTEFDQANLQWQVIATEVEDATTQLGQLTVNVNEVSGKVTNIEYVNNELVNITNELQLTVDGLKTSITITGGDNLIKDSMGTYGDIWEGNYNIDSSVYVKEKNIYGFALLLRNSNIHQEIALPNGTYTVSFLYRKHIPLANVKFVVNGTEYILMNDEYTSFEETFTVSSGTTNIYFESDTENSCTIVNLMLNQGDEKNVWSLNSNETWTDTLKMSSSGLTIDATGSDVMFNARADIIGFRNKNTNEYVAVFNDVGIDVKEIVVRNKAIIVGLLFQEINNQTVINRIVGDD